MPRITIKLRFLRRPYGVWGGLLLWMLGLAVPLSAQSVVGVDVASSRAMRLLDQADALLEQEQWDDAIDTLQTVASDNAGKLLATNTGQYVPITLACQARYCRLPSAPLEALRARIDPSAAALLEQAQETGSEQPLQQIVQQYFSSTYTPAALLLLADLSLQRADYNAARRALEQLHPWLTDPNGRPIGIALSGISIAEHWPVIRKTLEQPRTRLPAIYPDAQDAVAAGLARLVICSIHQQDFERAAVELALLQSAAPQSEGLLAGRQQPWVPTLSQLLTEARTWQSIPPARSVALLGCTPSREGRAAPLGPLNGHAWASPIQLALPPPPPVVRRQSVRIIANGRIITSSQPEPDSSTIPDPSVLPVVWQDLVLLRDRSKILAFHLRDGKPAVTNTGVLHASENDTANLGTNQQRIRQLQQMQLWGNFRFARQGVTPGPPTGPVMVADQVLFARVSPERQSGQRSGQVDPLDVSIQGWSLTREGLEVAHLEPPGEPWRFSGPPLVQHGIAFVALSAVEVRPRVAVAAYQLSTGQQLWITPICSGRPSSEIGTQRSPDALSLQGDRLYFNTNLGAVAALDTQDGQLMWLTTYPQKPMDENAGITTKSRPPAPCVCHRGQVLAAPSDSQAVFGLNAANGAVIWSAQQTEAGVQLLGAQAGKLVASGRQLTVYDTTLGQASYQWPATDRSGIRGLGRGCLAGDEIFWPTRNHIFVFKIATGEMTRHPLELGDLAGAGVNLTAAGDKLLVASGEQLTAFGRYAVPQQPPTPPEPSATSPTTDLDILNRERILSF